MFLQISFQCFIYPRADVLLIEVLAIGIFLEIDVLLHYLSIRILHHSSIFMRYEYQQREGINFVRHYADILFQFADALDVLL